MISPVLSDTGFSINLIVLLKLVFSEVFTLKKLILSGINSNEYTLPCSPVWWAKYRAVSPQQPPTSKTISPFSTKTIFLLFILKAYCSIMKSIAIPIVEKYNCRSYPASLRLNFSNIKCINLRSYLSFGSAKDLANAMACQYSLLFLSNFTFLFSRSLYAINSTSKFWLSLFKLENIFSKSLPYLLIKVISNFLILDFS